MQKAKAKCKSARGGQVEDVSKQMAMAYAEGHSPNLGREERSCLYGRQACRQAGMVACKAMPASSRGMVHVS